MATGQPGEVTLLATYCGKRLSLTVPTNAKVGEVVQKAAETLNLRREDLPLSLLYQGAPIDDMAPLDVSRGCREPTLQPLTTLTQCFVTRATLREVKCQFVLLPQVAMAKMKGVTAIHLVKRSASGKTRVISATAQGTHQC